MLKLLKDPLLHFLVLGALLFAASAWRQQGEPPPPERIVIEQPEVERLRDATALLRGRPPTREELAEVIEPTIRAEVLYREALALGLDVDDDEVRRRLIEKMQYLTESLADPEPPSEQALREFFASRPEQFRIPEAVTFEQVFFSPRARGEQIETDVADALRRLEAGAAPQDVGDSTPLQLRFENASRERIEVLFGEEMTGALFAGESGAWHGPYRSDFGLHLARVLDRSPARSPGYEQVSEQVAAAYAEAKRAERDAAEYAKMRARYDVVIEWPADGGEGAGSPAGVGEGA